MNDYNRHSEAVGIPRYGVQDCTIPQEIATPLRARNDSVLGGWFFCMKLGNGWWLVGGGMPPPYGRLEKSQKPVDKSSIYAKIFKNIATRYGKEAVEDATSERGQWEPSAG